MTYPGGKGKCYQRLINLMPPHSTYIETHLGSGVVLRNKRPAKINIGIEIDKKVLNKWGKLYPDHCQLIHDDANNFLKNYSFSGNELIYSDPPYFPSTRKRSKVYTYDYTEKEHEKLLNLLMKLPCNVMLSGYDNSMYSTRLKSWRKTSFLAKTHTDCREECVWMNFAQPKVLHDGAYLGSTFRERQSIKRRCQRIIDKFDRMPTIERDYVMQKLFIYFKNGDQK